MFTALTRAVGQLFDPRIIRILGYCVMLSALCIGALWFGIDWALARPLFEQSALNEAIYWLGGLATLVLTWFLFPLLVSVFIGLFLEPIAAAVEARHYPHLPKAPGLPFWAAIGASLRFLVLIVVVNLLLLFLLFFPIAYPIGYLVGNGYLIAREYFELVAFRRLATGETRALRRRHGAELLLLGAGTAFLFTLPLVNFIAPVIATAAMVHRFEAWRSAGGYSLGGG